MEIGNPFIIDQTWVVSNISLTMHGEDKKRVSVRLFSPGSQSVIRVRLTLEEYDAQYRDTWRLGRKIIMTMTWIDEMGQQQPTPVPPQPQIEQHVQMGQPGQPQGMSLGKVG